MSGDIGTQLEVAHSLLHALTEQMDAGIAIIDMNGYARLINRTARRMLRLSGDPNRKRLPELVQEPFRSFFQMAIRRMPEHTSWSQEITLPNQQVLHVSVSPIYPREGDQQGTITILQDVTPFRRVEHVKAALFTEIAHQLRTPLTSVRSALEVVEMGALEEGTQRMVRLAVRNVKRLARLVNQILETAEMERLHPRACSLTQCLNNALDLLSPDIEQYGASVTLDLDESRHYVYGEPGKLEQLFLLLLESGIEKYPHIHLQASVISADEMEGRYPIGFPGIAEQKVLEIQVKPVYPLRQGIVNRLVALHQGMLFWSNEALHVLLPSDRVTYELQQLRTTLTRAMQTATPEMPLSVMLLRLDRPLGSTVRHKLCRRVQHVVRQSDLISHWLHPDYLLGILHATSHEDAEAAIERIQRSVRFHHERGDLPEIHLDPEVLLCFPGDFDSIEELVEILREYLGGSAEGDPNPDHPR